MRRRLGHRDRRPDRRPRRARRSASPPPASRSSCSAPPPATPTSRQVAAQPRAAWASTSTGLRFADRQPWGARILHADSPTGRPLLVKVYGRDATDARLAARWWRTLIYRDQATPDATRLQLVEHEALVTILAERAGVAVDDVVAAAESSGDAVLVLGAPPRRCSRDRPEIDDAAARGLGRRRRLHGAGLVHGRLTLERIAHRPRRRRRALRLHGRPDRRRPTAQRAQEVAVLLTSQALAVGATGRSTPRWPGSAPTGRRGAALPPARRAAALAAQRARGQGG